MIDGTVIKSTGSWYIVKTNDGNEVPCRIKGKFRLGKLKVTNPVAVGDKVAVNIEKDEITVGTITKIYPRTNYVIRQSPRKKHFVHLLASNIDQAIVIVTLREPSLKIGFIDRFLLMIEPYSIPAVIVFNKTDLHKPEDQEYLFSIISIYTNIGYKVLLTSNETEDGIENFRAILKDKITLICGQSGVGKSTLINSIVPQLDLRTFEISEYSGKGQHTTTFAEMYSLENGGQIIDTPGIKTLGFNHFEELDVAHNFREFFITSKNCKYNNCMHRNEPNCAVKTAIENGEISELRYENYIAILEEVEDQNYWEIKKDI
ncbi:MAG: ribosome small subunit-dependent GTPase A [Saprospiraceae bacterium]